MTQDEELLHLVTQVRQWHRMALKRLRDDGLPEYEYSIALKRYIVYLRQGNAYYDAADLKSLRDLVRGLLYFVTPWEITVWYALNKKKQP